MQGNLDPISPYGRAFLGGVQGASPDQVAQRAAEVDKAGLIPFADAIRIKQMADQLSKSGAGMNQPQQGTVLDSLRGQIQSALGPQQMPSQQMPPQDQYAGLRALPVPDDMYAGVGMAGGGIVAFNEGGLYRGPYAPPQRMPYDAPVGAAFESELLKRIRAVGPAGAAPAPTATPDIAPPPAPRAAPPAPRAAPPAPRPAPPAPMGPTAPTGIASLISEPNQGAIQKEVDESYGSLKDALKRQDDFLKERGAKLTDRADAQSKLLLAMTGFQMAAEASKPGATFLGSAGAAGSEYAKSRIAANEKFADSMDKLADSRAELDVARAQLGVTQSDKAYDRFYKAQDDVYKQQTLLNQVRQLDIEEAANAQRASIYGSNIAIGDIDRALVAAHRQRMQSATDSPEYEQLTSQINQLSELRNTLDPTSGGTNERLTLQARQNLLNNSRYQELLQREQALRVSYANDPQDEEIGNQLEAVIASRIAMETEAKIALENALSGSTDVFGSSGFSANSNVVPYSELE